MKTIRIGGIGSVLLGDDSVGPYVARWLAAHYEFGEGVEVEDLGTPGLDLIAYMSGIDVLILVDAVDNKQAPGTVTVYDKEAITRIRPAVRMDAHSPLLTESIFVAELAGDGPQDIFLIGITGEQLEVGAGLSPAVQQALPQVVEKILAHVAQQGGTYRRRETPLDANIWWQQAVPSA